MVESSADAELPRAVALAWGVASNPQRGPKREMSIERIVEAAVAIADEGGLAAVSMASVASSLGFTPMSLYRYVSAKDDLILLMQEHGIGVPPQSIAETGSWREGLTTWALEQSVIFREHPWLLDIPVSSTPITPNNLSWMESALEVLDGVPLSAEEKTAVILAVVAQVRWQMTVERGYAAAAAANGGVPTDLEVQAAAVLDSLVTAQDFPFVREVIDARAFGPSSENPFEFGLSRVLDGIEGFVSSRPVPAARPSLPDVSRDPKVKDATKARREAEKSLREARKRERNTEQAARERLAR